MSEQSGGGAAIGVGTIAFPAATFGVAYWMYLNYGLLWAALTLPFAAMGGLAAVVIGGILLILLNLVLIAVAALPLLPFVGLYALVK